MVRLDHVHLFSSDPDAAARWYATMLGGRVVYDATVAGVRGVRIEIGDGLALQLYDQKPRGAERLLVHHLGLRTDDVAALVAHMAANGVAFRKPIAEDAAFRYAMCEGPDGILLELYQVKPGGEWMLGNREPVIPSEHEESAFRPSNGSLGCASG
jgi:catechol 2,3-dioxygenase-like lactoylglutathione lyase family enzyme